MVSLRDLRDAPPWTWPEGTGKALLAVLRDAHAPAADLTLAAELAGDYTVIDDDLAHELLAILRSGDRPAELRARAAISLGPVLEDADAHEPGDFDDVPITESTFHAIQASLRDLFRSAAVPGEVRRRILEASVRAEEDWHRDAVRAAYAGDDETWRLTAVFCMRFVGGFEAQILEALGSTNTDIRCEAVLAAGAQGVAAAWPQLVAIITAETADKPLLLAAIEAVASIGPREAVGILDEIDDSEDEDVAAAVEEAIAMAAAMTGREEAEDDDDDDDDP
jgi:hypothetical protein